jgi:hypothetical protein
MDVYNARTATEYVNEWSKASPARAAIHMTIAIESKEMALSILNGRPGARKKILDYHEAIGVLRLARLRFREAAGEIRTVASEPIR